MEMKKKFFFLLNLPKDELFKKILFLSDFLCELNPNYHIEKKKKCKTMEYQEFYDFNF